MTRIALVIAALALLGACGTRGPAGYVPPTRSAFDANPVIAPMAFNASPVVSSRSEITLF